MSLNAVFSRCVKPHTELFARVTDIADIHPCVCNRLTGEEHCHD